MSKLKLSGLIILLYCCISPLNAQISTARFGKGLQFLSKDSSFYTKMNVRIQGLMNNEWTLTGGSLEDFESSMLIRRSRLKMGGWAISPKIKYKFELGLSNRDLRGGSGSEFGKTANLILDAWVSYNFYKNFSIQFGQGKQPGNRERLISSGNLQFVDRSRLNSRFTLDRDIGFQLKHHHTILGKFLLRETFALSQGEGRNIIAGHFGGYAYTFKIEALPFGQFQSKGDYVSSAIKKEESPKLAVGLAWELNDNAVRERGQLGDFIIDDGNYYGKTLYTFFADLMFKYRNLSILSEFVDKRTNDKDPLVYNDRDLLVGTFYTGLALNIQMGYMLKKNWELAGRLTWVNPDEVVGSNETQYTLGISKFVSGHNLKVQTDFTYRDILNETDNFYWRTLIEFQF